MNCRHVYTLRDEEPIKNMRECPECNTYIEEQFVTWTNADQRLACDECRAKPRKLLAAPAVA